MAHRPSKTDDSWIDAWLDGVRSGGSVMSQRTLASIEAHGGLGRAIEAARQRRVHLVELTDDAGRTVVVAGVEPFRTLC